MSKSAGFELNGWSDAYEEREIESGSQENRKQKRFPQLKLNRYSHSVRATAEIARPLSRHL